MGLHEKETLLNSPNFGNLFETMIINDFLKRFLHFGQMPSMYYLRTRDGLEIDLVLEIDQKLHLFEIKSGMTITPKHVTSLNRMLRELSKVIKTANVISNSESDFLISDEIYNYNWKSILSV